MSSGHPDVTIEEIPDLEDADWDSDYEDSDYSDEGSEKDDDDCLGDSGTSIALYIWESLSFCLRIPTFESSAKSKDKLKAPPKPKTSTKPKQPPTPKEPKRKKLRPWNARGKPPTFPSPFTEKDAKSKHLCRLNVKRSYGKADGWGPAQGLRELVQNVFDGILEATGLQQHQLLVEEFHNGQFVNTADPTSPPPEASANDTIVFYFYRADDQPSASTDKPSTRKQAKPPPLGYVAWMPYPNHPGFGNIELFNIGKMNVSAWTFGFTTKNASKEKYIGGKGEGAKVGMSPLTPWYSRSRSLTNVRRWRRYLEARALVPRVHVHGTSTVLSHRKGYLGLWIQST